MEEDQRPVMSGYKSTREEDGSLRCTIVASHQAAHLYEDDPRRPHVAVRRVTCCLHAQQPTISSGGGGAGGTCGDGGTGRTSTRTNPSRTCTRSGDMYSWPVRNVFLWSSVWASLALCYLRAPNRHTTDGACPALCGVTYGILMIDQ